MTRYAKRTDHNQPAIVTELRDRGVQVVITNFGEDFPDLLCGFMGDWTLLEVKQPDGCLDRGQLLWISNAKARVGVVTNPAEATSLVVINRGLITRKQQDAIAVWLVTNPKQESLSVKKFRKVIQGQEV